VAGPNGVQRLQSGDVRFTMENDSEGPANTLNGGDTVIVNAGTYNQRVQVITSGSAGKLLTFQAQGTVVMQGFNIQASCVKLTGFEITNTPGSTNRSCQRIRSLSVGKQH